jgi:hypothetical protein
MRVGAFCAFPGQSEDMPGPDDRIRVVAVANLQRLTGDLRLNLRNPLDMLLEYMARKNFALHFGCLG